MDWRNKSSPNFWSKLGGIFLAQASDVSSLRLLLPPGEHMLGVVAEDGLGAVPHSVASILETGKPCVCNSQVPCRSGLQFLAHGPLGAGS